MSKRLKYILVILIVAAMAIPTGVGIVNANKIPTFDIVSVVPDEVVTIETHDFPADMKFDVLIGKYGNFGVDGIKVGTQDSDKGGTFTATYKIPAELKGVSMLSIRLEDKETGYYSYNWFENAAMPAEDKPATTSETETEEEVFHPSFTITSVEMNKNITVTGSGFPKDMEYDVLMGSYGSAGIGGVKVSTQKTGAKGEFKATYTIPADFEGQHMVSVRMESAKSAYYAFNYFYNTTFAPVVEETKAEATEAATPAKTEESTEAAYVGYPSFTVEAVKMKTSITIKAENLPAGEVFDVFMTDYADDSAEPVKAGTLDTKKGGSMDATFVIPAGLIDLKQISVRMTGTKTGYFAYNYFYNNDFPVVEMAPEAAATEAATPATAPETAATPAPTATP